MEFSSHGWLCWAALLKMYSVGNRQFLARRMWAGGAQVVEWWREPSCDSMCDLGCGLAFLWALAPPEPCCQSSKPASHAGLSCLRANQVFFIPSQRPPLLG